MYTFNMSHPILGLQNLFIAIGALVLVPILTGFDPCVALFTAGVGTLLFQVVTKWQVPVFLGSSFAFIAPTMYGVATWGMSATLSGLVASSVVYFVLSFVVRFGGHEILLKAFPPIVTGPIIMGIGLMLAPVAANMAMGLTGDGAAELFPRGLALIVSGVSLAAAVGTYIFAKGRLKLVPILMGIMAGYLLSVILGVVDFSHITQASWFKVPGFVMPTWHLPAILFIVPVALVTSIEHIGDILAIRSITGQDYLQKPGLHRTLLGDGVASAFASMIGGPPNTTYSEVTAGIAITKQFNPFIMTWSAFFAIILAFVAKLGAILQTIPTPVMGGILILLFGTIAVIGMSTIMRSKADLLEPRNLCIIAVILILPVSGMSIMAGPITLNGIALGSLFGVVLNLILPAPKNNTMHH